MYQPNIFAIPGILKRLLFQPLSNLAASHACEIRFCIIAEDFGWSQREGDFFPRPDLWEFCEVLSYDLGWMQRRGRRKGKEARMGATHSAQRWPVSSKWFLFLSPVFLTINPWSVGTKRLKDDPQIPKWWVQCIQLFDRFPENESFFFGQNLPKMPSEKPKLNVDRFSSTLILIPWPIEWKTQKIIPKRPKIVVATQGRPGCPSMNPFPNLPKTFTEPS